jgi:hypothetical protein
VGDYTAGFAEELRYQGHEALVIALADGFVGEAKSINRDVPGGSVRTLRLPSSWPWKQRIEYARQQLDPFNPEWVSFQFVCYSYHPKGIIRGLAEKISPLIRGRRLHVMFHEIWLCKELGFGWRQRAIGALQLRFIRNFVQTTSPNVMHSSNATYVALLKRHGILAEELALFGNVPVLDSPSLDWIESQLRGTLGDGYRREAVWLFGFFGGLPAQWPREPLLTDLCRAAAEAGKKPVLLSIGRIGETGLELWNGMKKHYADRITFLRLGEQPVEHVSEYLSFLDYGLATTTRSILGKSGTVVSMLEHGLPVIVNRDDAPSVKGLTRSSEPLLIPCDGDFRPRLRVGGPRGPRGSRRPEVAKSFLSALAQAAAPILCSK